ncbi:hypothetical protein BDV95DRAFT_591365 [Massariosphaeria phaeospora]|uniref:Rhodopsin domain-containing protein n=1 Tax=Massariosphaeria phaeospora TaxID=100035 RepID=A0A7C8MEV8_9PLEO|nr:hypothetical protein BDV95DRAFT_591365 [Massariosphaeria phaeospora]
MAAMPDLSLIPSPPSPAAQANARAFAGVVISLDIIATLVFAGRLWTRFFPVYRMRSDDYVILVGYVLIMVDSIVLFLAVPYSFGREVASITLADTQDSQRYAVISQPLWAWSMAAIKISVALMMLRLEQTKFWRRFLWGMVAVQMLLGIYNMLCALLQCIPLHAAWDPLKLVEAKCWSSAAIRANLYCISVVNVVTDFIMALLPISFLRHVQRPFRERAIIGGLMALGVFAGVASIIKVVASTRYGRTNDLSAEGIQVGMWSCIEELVAFIAACIPCLRSLFQQVLEHFGLVSTHGRKSTYNRTYGQMYGESGQLKVNKQRKPSLVSGGTAIRMKSMKSADAVSEENILTDDEVKNGEIWCTTEVHMQQEEAPRHDDAHKIGSLDRRTNASLSDEARMV